MIYYLWIIILVCAELVWGAYVVRDLIFIIRVAIRKKELLAPEDSTIIFLVVHIIIVFIISFIAFFIKVVGGTNG